MSKVSGLIVPKLSTNDPDENIRAVKDKNDPLIETEDGDRPLSGVWETADLIGLYEATEAWRRLTDEKNGKKQKNTTNGKNKVKGMENTRKNT